MRLDVERTVESGFTSVELLTAIAIMAILASIGVPTYRTITMSSRVSAEINSLLGDMQYARSEALKEGRRVTACISTDGESCTGGALWQGGWIVFSDPDGDATVDSGETVLRVQKPFSATDTLEEASGLGAITFNRAGFALNLTNAGAQLTLHDSLSNSRYTRCLSITLVGMVTTQTHASSPTTCT